MRETSCAPFGALPSSLRLTYILTLLVLGLGYVFATIQVFEAHAGRDGNAMLSVQDLIIAYSGNRADTRLESALKGPMSGMLPKEEAAIIIGWIHSGASRAGYEAQVLPIFENRCAMCHGGQNPHIPNLRGYENIMQKVSIDTGMDILKLIRVSHIHLFGLTFIFFIVSTIFCHARLRPDWLKYTVIAIPFVAILADVTSWYLTKIYQPFAWVVLITGVLMGICFAVQWVVSLYQLLARPE